MAVGIVRVLLLSGMMLAGDAVAVWSHGYGVLSGSGYDIEAKTPGISGFSLHFRSGDSIQLTQGQHTQTLPELNRSALYITLLGRLRLLQLVDQTHYSHILVSTFLGILAYLMSAVDGAGNSKSAAVTVNGFHKISLTNLEAGYLSHQVSLVDREGRLQIIVQVTIGRRVEVSVTFGQQTLLFQYEIPVDELVIISMGGPRYIELNTYPKDDDDEDDRGCCTCLRRSWSLLGSSLSKPAAPPESETQQGSQYGATGQTCCGSFMGEGRVPGVEHDYLHLKIEADLVHGLQLQAY
ncbi:MAG: hypothetical protein ACR2PT_05645 [Endozoicomonas sp.]